MSSEERTYWPTDAKLEELREAGDMPFSSLAVLCAATGVAIGVAYLLFGTMHEAAQHFGAVMRLGIWSGEGGYFATLLLRVLVVPAVSIAAGAVTAGLLQTKFWLSFHRLSLDLSRLLPRLDVLNPLKLLARAAARIILIPLVAAAVIGCSVWFGRSLLLLLNADRGTFAAWSANLAHEMTVIALAALVMLGLSAYLIARLWFKVRHRMTKQELERELRGGA